MDEIQGLVIHEDKRNGLRENEGEYDDH